MDNKLPPPIQVTQGTGNDGNSPKYDDSLIKAGFEVKNPFQKFFEWLKSLIKNEGIKITIKPLTAVAIAVALTGGGGIVGGIIVYFFPHSSPILHREVVYQGSLQKTDKGFYLTLPNSDLYTLKPKAKSSINFQSLTNGSVLVKGNLTRENFVIEVAEVIPLNPAPSGAGSNTPTSPTLLNSPNPVMPKADELIELPSLYSGLEWVTTQKRLLIFTSGKRKIEQEGVYLESAQLNSFPQDFINYYIEELKNAGFKQTLNSIDPEGITITYAKDDLFLTFGTKNKYSGSGDKKQLTGYTAFIEHN